MCKKIACETCSKPTWKGCGQHIDAALADVEVKDRCLGWKSGKCASGFRRQKVPNDGRWSLPKSFQSPLLTKKNPAASSMRSTF